MSRIRMANTGVRDVPMNIRVPRGATMCLGTGWQIGSEISGEGARADSLLGAGGDARHFFTYTNEATPCKLQVVGMRSGLIQHTLPTRGLKQGCPRTRTSPVYPVRTARGVCL
jgi:hypothetical protein